MNELSTNDNRKLRVFLRAEKRSLVAWPNRLYRKVGFHGEVVAFPEKWALRIGFSKCRLSTKARLGEIILDRYEFP